MQQNAQGEHYTGGSALGGITIRLPRWEKTSDDAKKSDCQAHWEKTSHND